MKEIFNHNPDKPDDKAAPEASADILLPENTNKQAETPDNIEPTEKNETTKLEPYSKAHALKLIETGQGWSVANDLENFHGLDHKEVALKLIESDGGSRVAINLEKFQGLDHKEVALKLIEAGQGWSVTENLENFQGLDHKEIALKIIEAGQGESVVNNLENFQGLNHKEIALKIIEAGWGWSVANNLEKFQGLDHKEVALKLIETGQGESVVNNLKKFQGLDSEVALKLIETGQGERVAENLENFQGLDHKEIALKLFEVGQGWSVANDLKNFQGLDHKEIALKLIEAVQGSSVAQNLEKFQGLDHKEIALKLIEAGVVAYIPHILKKFQGLDSEVALKLIEAGQGWSVTENLENFQGLNREVALKLIEAGQGWSVTENLENFQGLNREVALKLIEAGQGESVANNLENFQGLDHKEIAQKLVLAGSSLVVENNAGKFSLPAECLAFAQKNHLRLSEAVLLDDRVFTENAPDYSAIFDTLIAQSPDWKDQENIVKPFQQGAELFGHEKMFVFLNRDGLTRHDGLHNFTKIATLAQASSLEPKVFYNNILEQVRRDDAEYTDGTAHHYLNNIANNISSDWQATKAKIAEYADVEKLADLARTLEKPADIFSSWKNLKKYEELSRLLEQADILKQLQELKKSGNDKLYHYIETLAFHPNIAMEKVFQFWRDPQAFLELDDSHTPTEVQDRKKPSNYVEFPNLDLSAEELRDALVNGTYDQLQVFNPLTIEYRLPKAGAEKLAQPLLAEVTRALGKRKANIKGEAKNAPKLFKELQIILKAEKITISDFLDGQVELPKQVAHLIRERLYNQDVGLPLNKKDIEEYRAKINLKSDPDGVVAGNDTSCCMPFGSGKNNVYTFNPNCALFTLQKKNANDTWRTIAQSVLTKDVDIGKNVSEVVNAMRDESHLNEVIPEDILRQKQSVIACDNIEVSPNFRGDEGVISSVYRDFFNEYINKYGAADDFDKTKVVIGQGNTDTMTHLPTAENHFVPKAPVGYSDKLGKSVYVLALGKETTEQTISDVPILSREVKTDLQAEKAKTTPSKELPKGISPLTFEDSLPVAYIEGKAYQDNQNLIEYLHNMENALIAKDVNNATKQRPNMSLKYEDDTGVMHGYILAYEGKVNKADAEVMYVSDLASDGNKRAGGSLILGFTQSYKQNYLDQGKLIPIYAQMREKTSYAIITKQLEKLSADSGMRFEIEELDSYDVGGDTMHRVLIKPIKNQG